MSETNLSPHSVDTGNYYPFERPQSHSFRWLRHIGWDGGLAKAWKGRDGIYRDPEFNLGNALETAGGPIVEIGGPSLGGYVFLRGLPLADRPLITNISDDPKKANERWTASSKVPLDAFIDGRKLPFPDSSIGVILSSNMDRTYNGRTAGQIGGEAIKLTLSESRPFINVDVAHEDALRLLKAHKTDDLLEQTSPSIGVTVEAARVLRSGGLYVANGLGAEDAQLAEEVGLKLVMHTPMIRTGTSHFPDSLIREAIFIKS